MTGSKYKPMAASHSAQSSLVHSLATLLRNNGDVVLDGSSTLTLPAASLQQLTRLFEQHLLPRSQQHGFLALPSHPADTTALLQLQFLFDVLQKTVSFKLINPPGRKIQSVVKIFPFKSLRSLELKRIPPHCLEGLRGIYSQLEVFTCSKSLSTLEELLSLCGGDLSSALPWLELHTLNFSYNFLVCLDQSISLLNVLKSLDLSHNKIQECAEFLTPLSELEHLNLGYNCLQRAPTLAPTARAKLVTLVLRNNELETINGVEQLSSLRHLDLAYNLLLEHSQLAPLSLLHCLNTLNVEGNPLYFQKSHRACTVRHLSPKAATLKFKLDSAPLSLSELSVLPKPGQHILQVHTLPPVATASERSNQEVSSGAGDLSDSQSVGEVVAVSSFRKKKSRSRVKVRRASISEPSDADHEPRPLSSSQAIVLPHQQEIERMSSFRDQLGEDWLRYQHHLDLDAPPSAVAPVPVTNQQPAQIVTNGLGNTDAETREEPPTPLLFSEPEAEASAELDTDSTLQWPGNNTQHADSTLEESVVDGLAESRDAAGSPEASPVSQRSSRAASRDANQEEDEDLGVDLCLPLLVGVLSDIEEVNGDAVEESPPPSLQRGGRRSRREVFLRVKQGLVLEVDVQYGRERCRLELDSLVRVETGREAEWTLGETKGLLPCVELQFDYISKEKRRRRYVLLDDDPQQALQALSDVLSNVAVENRRRDSELRPRCVRLQCLRCTSEFTRPRGNVGGRRGAAMLPEGGAKKKEQEEEEEVLTEGDGLDEDGVNFCPECGSDHVVQVALQPGPHSCSTPIRRSPRPDSEDGGARSTNQVGDRLNRPLGGSSFTGASRGSSPPLEPAPPAASPEDSAFVTARGSSFFLGDDDAGGLSYDAERHGKEELAGSYRYNATGATPPQDHAQPQPGGRSSPHDDLDLLSEDYEAVDHRLQLYLDVEVFEAEEEELHCFLKMSAVKFGEPGEVPSLLVVSNQRIYFLEVTSDVQGHLGDWLRKTDSYPILELGYLEVGLASQSIRMEFGESGGVAYTLLVRDSVRCKRFFSTLTGIVRELAHKSDSKLQSISTTRLTPQHHLWPLVCEDIQDDVEDGQLQFFYILAFVLQDDVWTPLTVLATRETLHLLQEDHQARRGGPPESGGMAVLETLPISCVNSVQLWPAHRRRMDIKLYDETLKQERTWCMRSESGELLQGLLDWVRVQWEAMFSVKLHTSLQDKAA